MTEQQKHLKGLLEDRETMINEINRLNDTLRVRRENMLKVQGIIEYLTQTGVTLPEENEEKVSEQPAPAPEVETISE